MRTTLVLLALAISCGGAEPQHQNNPPPPAAQMTARLRYDYVKGNACGNDAMAACAQVLTLAATSKASLISSYASCRLSDGAALFDIDCTGKCIHQQAAKCGGVYYDLIQCPAPAGTPQYGDSCGWHFP